MMLGYVKKVAIKMDIVWLQAHFGGRIKKI
jgi:hypothetical protein